MRGVVPARHLLRRYVLFTLVLLCFLSLARATLALWQFDRLIAADALLPVFLTGLRFDLALCGVLLFVPVALGTFLGLFTATAALARFVIVTGLVAGMVMTLLAEFITPVFINETGLRPDLNALLSLEQPVELARRYLNIYPLPVAIGAILVVLITIAFIARLEPNRLLRQRLRRLSGVLLWSGATLACLFAIVSGPRPVEPWLSPRDAQVSSDARVNELPLNSLYKTLYELARTP